MKGPENFEELVRLCHQAHEDAQNRAVRATDVTIVVRNWLFGRYIVEFEQNGSDRAGYGKRLLAALSESLKDLGLKGVGATNLKLARQFYTVFGQIGQKASYQLQPERNIGQTLSDQFTLANSPQRPLLDKLQTLSRYFPLGWSHYVELLTISDPDERSFYEIEAAANQWGVRELQRQISSSLYHRLALSRDKSEIRRLAVEGQVVQTAADLIKNPLVLEFLGLDQQPHYSEDELESAIIDKLESFLLELGKGFLFEARQKRFTFDNDHFYVDLVFYNRLLRCYVLIDLKRDKLTHQDLGQMQMYVNYFDRHVKLTDELPTIGIVMCSRKNDALVELTLTAEANIFATKYQLYLPSKEELKSQLETIADELRAEAGEPRL